MAAQGGGDAHLQTGKDDTPVSQLRSSARRTQAGIKHRPSPLNPAVRSCLLPVCQADVDGNGNLDMSELQDIMKNPQFVSSAMEHLDLNLDGCVSLREWLISMKTTFDKSEAACKTALKMHEKGERKRNGPKPNPTDPSRIASRL